MSGAKDYLTELFFELDKNNISYLILRNFNHDLPEKIGKDIDIMVKPEDFVKFCFITTTLMNKNGFYIIKTKKTFGGIQLIGISKKKTNRELKFDVTTFLRFQYNKFHKVPLCSKKIYFEEITSKKHKGEGCYFPILGNKHEFISLYQQWKRKKKKSYQNQLKKLLNDAEVKFFLFDAFGQEQKERIEKEIEMGIFPAPETIKRMIKNEWNYSLFDNIRLKFRNKVKIFKILLLYFDQLIEPVIYFSGPDGSGKSTISKEFCKQLEKAGVKVLRIRNYRFFVTNLMRKKNKRMGNKKGKNTRNKKQKGYLWRVRRFMGLLIGLFDIFFNYFYYLWFRLKGWVVVVDTSPYDVFVKTRRPEFPFVEKIGVKIIPIPTVGFLMCTEPQAIIRRKKDLNEIEIKDYYKRIEKIITKSKGKFVYKFVDNNNKEEQAIDFCLSSFSQKLLEKTLKNYNKDI